jgi:hypothetical protein
MFFFNLFHDLKKTTFQSFRSKIIQNYSVRMIFLSLNRYRYIFDIFNKQ